MNYKLRIQGKYKKIKRLIVNSQLLPVTSGPARNASQGSPSMAGGQALITVLFYVLTLITIITAAIILQILNISTGTKLQEGTRAYYIAESGTENALLRVLRDPTYTGETNLPIGDGFATIVVTPGSPTTIVTTGRVGNFVRKIQVTAAYTAGYYTINSWQEIQ